MPSLQGLRLLIRPLNLQRRKQQLFPAKKRYLCLKQFNKVVR